MQNQNFYSAVQPSFRHRIWRGLGFGTRHLERPDDFEGFAPGYVMTRTIAVFDWRDRLRILVSGRVLVESITQTDVVVKRTASRSQVSILNPDQAI